MINLFGLQKLKVNEDPFAWTKKMTLHADFSSFTVDGWV